ncbi:MAG: inositol monophosphatase family protein [Natrialbaceae archaeon]|nr:inositol monophosphatase family protein [Natrialbaceae archaeon]
MSSDRVDIAGSGRSAGAEVAHAKFRTALEVDTRSTTMDLVTNADRDAQTAVIETIQAHYPDDPMVSEENAGPVRLPESGPCWIVDPIDGTNNYVNGIREFATAVAVIDSGECIGAVIHCPALDDCYRVDAGGAVRNGHDLTVSHVDSPTESTICPTSGGASTSGPSTARFSRPWSTTSVISGASGRPRSNWRRSQPVG